MKFWTSPRRSDADNQAEWASARRQIFHRERMFIMERNLAELGKLTHLLHVYDWNGLPQPDESEWPPYITEQAAKLAKVRAAGERNAAWLNEWVLGND